MTIDALMPLLSVVNNLPLKAMDFPQVSNAVTEDKFQEYARIIMETFQLQQTYLFLFFFIGFALKIIVIILLMLIWEKWKPQKRNLWQLFLINEKYLKLNLVLLYTSVVISFFVGAHFYSFFLLYGVLPVYAMYLKRKNVLNYVIFTFTLHRLIQFTILFIAIIAVFSAFLAFIEILAKLVVLYTKKMAILAESTPFNENIKGAYSLSSPMELKITQIVNQGQLEEKKLPVLQRYRH